MSIPEKRKLNVTFPIYDDQGNLYRMAGISTDISFHKQGQIEILKALQRERELSEAKTNLISIISHEIRTPLAIIQSSCDIIQHSLERLTETKKQLHFQKNTANG
jgi:signal transduction histidine kinase